MSLHKGKGRAQFFHLHIHTCSSCSPKHWGHSMHGRVPPVSGTTIVCCHPDPLLHPPDTTTPLLARYLLIKIWLPGNRLQIHTHAHAHTHTCMHTRTYMHTHTHSSYPTVGKWHEMHGRMPLPHGLTTSL